MTAIALGATAGAIIGLYFAVQAKTPDPLSAFLMSLGATLEALWGWGV